MLLVDRLFCAALWLTVAFLPLEPAVAHHSPAMFDLSRDVMLEGTLAEVSWRNPHVYFEIEVAGPDGRTTTQVIESQGAANLTPLGIGADSFRKGERVLVQAKPRRSGQGQVLGWLLTKADGTVIPLHSRAAPPTEPGTAEASSIAGTWVPQATEWASLAVAARDWPLTDAGRAAATALRAARDASRAACIPIGPPALMSLPAVVQVEVAAAAVTFRLDYYFGAVRVVHLDLTEHPALEASLHGHSIGRWDGGTLVVDTVGYSAHPEGFAFDLPSSAAKHVVERFTLAADRKHLAYEVVVEDPEYLAAPVSHRAHWDYRPEQQPSNLACDAVSAGRFAIDP